MIFPRWWPTRAERATRRAINGCGRCDANGLRRRADTDRLEVCGHGEPARPGPEHRPGQRLVMPPPRPRGSSERPPAPPTGAVQLVPSPAGVLCTVRNLGPVPVRLIDSAEEAVLVIQPGMTVQCSPAWAAPPPPAEPTAPIVAPPDHAGTPALAERDTDWAARAALSWGYASRADVDLAHRLLLGERQRFLDALRLIGWYGCEHFTGRHSCRTAGSGKTRNGYYGGEHWCDACIALDALGTEPGTRPVSDGWYGLSEPQRTKPPA